MEKAFVSRKWDNSRENWCSLCLSFSPFFSSVVKSKAHFALKCSTFRNSCKLVPGINTLLKFSISLFSSDAKYFCTFISSTQLYKMPLRFYLTFQIMFIMNPLNSDVPLHLLWSCVCSTYTRRDFISPDEVPPPAFGLCCCTIFLHLTPSRRGLTRLLTGPVSKWKRYKSTVVQEAFAISSLLRHKRITVPLTQTTTTWDPVQCWNFPTDKNTLTVQSNKLTGSLGCSCCSDPFSEWASF